MQALHPFAVLPDRVYLRSRQNSKEMASEIRRFNTSVVKLDELFSSIQSYRDGQSFIRLMNFCASFHMVGAYNAMLIDTQREGVRYALNVAGWRKYNRRPKPDARPVMILMPFAPVDFLFDVSDTEHVPGAPEVGYEDELERLAHPFLVEGKLDPHEYTVFLSNLKYLGIKLNPRLFAGGELAARICREEGCENETIVFKGKNRGVMFPYYYRLSVNGNATDEEQFASICHELGHYFCYHLQPPTMDWWEPRSIAPEQAEFEAECVAWLVCGRHGLKSANSIEYLAGKCSEIPQIAMGTVMSAVDSIERLFVKLTASESLLYKNSEEFYRNLTGKRRSRNENRR